MEDYAALGFMKMNRKNTPNLNEELPDTKIIKSSFGKQKIYSIRAVNLVDAKRFSCLYKNEES